ncbi:MAG: RidA family protein [Pseudomonadota bacterium]
MTDARNVAQLGQVRGQVGGGRTVRPEGWPRPKGYAHAVAASGTSVFVSGQIGWDENEMFHSDDFVDQVRQALQNTVAILAAAGAEPDHITRMTWYITDKQEYLARQAEIGAAYREIMGRTFPAMSVVQVADLLEDRAKVEIESTAVV